MQFGSDHRWARSLLLLLQVLLMTRLLLQLLLTMLLRHWSTTCRRVGRLNPHLRIRMARRGRWMPVESAAGWLLRLRRRERLWSRCGCMLWMWIGHRRALIAWSLMRGRSARCIRIGLHAAILTRLSRLARIARAVRGSGRMCVGCLVRLAR